uniref:Pup--protein ligase n=1 Tax=Candidatus Methanophagaceae archaeon ANME-1 ERB6 TaxID=2759912 RepID=A0A7G9YSC0_9EURY|nr:Pup--protein ligase [Methanosarcinales archaeon ANME-1 ERB6]
MDLNKWQGVEHEFRVGISSESPGLYRYARFYHVDEVIHALETYTFFDGTDAICSKLRRRNDGFLRNGSRIYICTGGHLEIATPECRNAFEALKYDKAAELYMQIGVERANKKYREKLRKRANAPSYIQCWKANVEIDKRYSRGTHESYAVVRRNFVGKENLFIPFLILRKIFFGAGGFVAEKEGLKYVISPKAMVSKRVLTESPSQWPILSTRDEPLGTKDKYRVHVTSGEGVRSEVTRLLNNALTSYVLDAIETGKLSHVEDIWNPLQTFKDISANTEGDWRVKLTNGRTELAIDYLEANYLAVIEELFEERETSYWDKYVLDTFKRLCDKFRQGLLEDPYVVRRLEWVMKLWVIKNEINDFDYKYTSKGKFDYRSIYMMDEEIEKEIAASFDFTNLCDYDLYERIADKIGVERILTEEEIGEALLFPPKDSRAELRVRLASEFGNAALSWNKITINREPKIKIDLGRPTGEEYSRMFERYPELARMPSAVVVFLRERRRGEATRQVLVRLLAEEEDIRGWEEEISREIRNRIVRNPYLDYLLYSNNKTYRFDELDGWNEDTIKKRLEEINRAEEESRGKEEEV